MQEKALANGLELNPNRIARINKEEYLCAKVSDHFAWSWHPCKVGYPLLAAIGCSNAPRQTHRWNTG